MQPRACFLTALALIVACLARGTVRELNETPEYEDSILDGNLTKDCILAGGRSSCVNFTRVVGECAMDLSNDTYTVHFLLGPMHKTDLVLKRTLFASEAETGARWYVQNRSAWDESLLDLARGRNSFYDGLILDPAIVPEMVASKALLDLEPFLATDRWAGHWPGILSVLRWQVAATKSSMLPLGSAAMVLHYRADVLNKHRLSVPQTWEQLLVAVGAVHGRPNGVNEADPEFYGFCTMPHPGCHADSFELLAVWASFIQTQGHGQGAFFDPETFTPLVHNAGMRAALLYLRLLRAFAPPNDLPSSNECNSMYGTAELLYETGKCAFQLAPHPSYKRNLLLSPSEDVKHFSRVTWLPGATSVLDRWSSRLVPCGPSNCPFAKAVPLWPDQEKVGIAVLSGNISAAAAAVDAAVSAKRAAAELPSSSSFVLTNMAPVLGLGPLGLGVNNFTSLRQKAYSLSWLRRVTNPETVWELVVSPDTPFAPFRYEHFSPSNLWHWIEAGYDGTAVQSYLDLSYAVLTHGNLLSYPMALQRMLQFRTALHAAAYSLATSDQSVDTIMENLATAIATSFGPTSYGFGTLRLQYLASIGRYDLLTAPAPPPPPPPPQMRYIVGREIRPQNIPTQNPTGAVGGAVGSVAAVGVIVMAVFLYKQLMVERGWGRSKDPGVGTETTLVVTDIEASTVLWEELDALVMDAALNLHHETIRRVILQWSGYESVTEGDSFTVAFHTAAAAVGFSLHVQSELMDQPWPPEVLMHEACRPVYVVGTKRLRHLAAKAAAARHTTTAMETLDSEAHGASGRSMSLFGRSSGTGVLPVNSASGASAALPPPRSCRMLGKALRRIDVITGLSLQLRSMSFMTRPASGSNSVRGSLLTVALAGGGGGSGTAVVGGGGSASAAITAAAAAAYGGGSEHALALSRRAPTGDSVLLEAAVPYGSSGVNSSRKLFDHFLPYNAASALPPRLAPSGSAAGTAGSMSMSLSLGKLPVGFAAANASGVGGTAAGVAAAGFAFRAPSISGQPMDQLSPFQDSQEQNESGAFALPAEANVVPVDTGEGDANGNGGGGRLVSGTASVGTGHRVEHPAPARTSSILEAPASELALASIPSVIGSMQVARMGQFTGVASVPEEPSLLPSPFLSRQVVRRTQSTMMVTGGLGIGAVGDAAGSGGANAGVDRLPTLVAASQLRAMASVPAIFGPHANTRSPLKAFVENSVLAASGRRPSRHADPPPPIYRSSPDDGHSPAGGGVTTETLQGSSVYGSCPETASHPHVTTGTVAGEMAKESPLIYNGLRERHGLEDDTGGPMGRSLRGWRSWTGSSLGFLRRMQRSFRHVTYAAAVAAAAATTGASKISFSGIRSGDAGGGGGDDDGVAATVPSMGPEALEVVSRDAAGWDVESRSSSHSHGPPSSASHGSTIQSTLQLQPSRTGRHGGAAAAGKLYASPSTYGSELCATWMELPCNLGIDPASVGAVLVFRGFRVRCGMHSGVSTAAEVNRQHPSGRTRYSGPALMCAKAVSDAAHGGMVFASRHTVAQCPAQLLANRVVLWRLGDHVLGSPRLPATLYQLSNTALVLRAALQRPLTRTIMPLGLGLLDAPLSVVACAAIRLASKTLLEQAAPVISMEAASVFQALSYQYARLHGGYVAQLGAGRAMCIFPDAYRASLWAALVASGMASHAWSRELLTMEQCGVWSILDSQGREMQVPQGPRIQAVVHFGAVSTSLHPLTGQLSYEGGAVDTTMRVLNGLNTTGVVATLEAAASLRRYRPADATRAAVHGVAGANGSNNSTGQLPSQHRRSSSRCRTDVEGAGGGGGDGTGSASQRSSAATWRETIAPMRSLHHLNHYHFQLMQPQQQDGLLPRSRSSAEHLASLGARVSGVVGGSSSGVDHGGGGSGSAYGRLLAHSQPSRIGGVLPSGRSRVIVPRRASGPILGRGAVSTSLQASSHEGMMAAAAAAASSLSGRRGDENLRGASPTQRSTVPRAASAVIPVSTDSANTSGTEGADGGTGGAGSCDSRRDSQIDGDSTAGPFTAAARHISTQQLSINLGTMPTFRTGGAGAGTASEVGGDAVGVGGRAGDGDGASRAAALATSGGGMFNDSLLLLLITSSESPQSGGATAGGGGGGRRDYGNVSYSSGNPLLGWMISGGVPLGSNAANAMATGTRHGHLVSQLDSNLGCASDLRADGSTGNEDSTRPGAPEGLQLPVAGDWGNRFTLTANATSSAADAGSAKGKPMGPDPPQPKLNKIKVAEHRSSTPAVAAQGSSGDVTVPVADWRSKSMRDFPESAAAGPREGSPQPHQAGARRAQLTSAASVARAEMDMAVCPSCGTTSSVVSEPPPFPPPPTYGPPVESLPPLSAAESGDAVSMPAGALSVPSNDASDCRPPAGGAGMSSQSASSGGSVSPSSPLSHRHTNARVMAAASPASITAAAAAVEAEAPSLRPTARQSIDSTAISSTQPSDSAEPSSDPDAAPSTAMVFPMPIKRPPRPRLRQLRPQSSARDSTNDAVLGPERMYESFTFGQKKGSIARPRLQDLLSVSPYASVMSSALAAMASKEAGAEMQPSEACGGRDIHFLGEADSRHGGGSATVYSGGTRQVTSSIQQGSPTLQPDQRNWGSDLPSPPSTRTGYSGGQGSSSLEALLRGPHGRISRSFTFTTHRRSPLAVSSYAGDPEIGTVTSGNGGAGPSGGMRPMSSLSRVLYGSGATIGLVSREAAAVAGGGYDASRETTPRGSSHGPQGAAATVAVVAAAAAAAAAVGFGSGSSITRQSRPRDAIPAGGNTSTGSGSGSGTGCGGGQVYRSPSMSRSTLGRRGCLPHTQAGDSRSVSATLLSGPYCAGGLQPWAAGGGGNGAGSVSAHTLPPDYPHSSNSAGTLPISLNSTQLRTSIGEYRGSGHDCRGSGGTSAASANTLPPNMDASVAVIHSSTARVTVPSTADAAGHFSGILARVKGSMAKARSKSISRVFVSAVAPLDIGLQTVGTSSPGGSGAGSIRTDLAVTGTGSGGDASGASTRLPATSQFPSGSSGGGGGIAAAASRTLRGLMLTEKLPSLPEGSLVPLMREIRHLRLRLVPLRLAGRAAIKGSAISTAQDMAGGMMVSTAESGGPAAASERHQREQVSYATGRATVNTQVYRVMLLARDPSTTALAPMQPPPLGVSPGQAPGAAALQGMRPSLSLPPPQRTQQTQGSGTIGQNANQGLSNSSQSRRSETDPEYQTYVSISGASNCQGPNVRPKGEQVALVDVDASQSMTIPFTNTTGNALGDGEEVAEAALVSQFFSGFADLADPQLAELWAEHPERSLLQDRRLGNVAQLRARLATQVACDAVFDRDNFLF